VADDPDAEVCDIEGLGPPLSHMGSGYAWDSERECPYRIDEDGGGWLAGVTDNRAEGAEMETRMQCGVPVAEIDYCDVAVCGLRRPDARCRLGR